MIKASLPPWIDKLKRIEFYPRVIGLRTKNRLKRRLASARTYTEWRTAAEALDTALGLDAWRTDPESSEYRSEILEDHVARLRGYRMSGAFTALLEFLPESIYRNLSDLNANPLYEVAYGGTKHLVSSYYREAVSCLRFLCDAEIPGVSDEEKLRRFKHGSHSFGRSALLLSGGATLGYYHLGVARALWEEDLLPWVVSGSSMGAIIASAVCTRSDAELAPWFETVCDTPRKSLNMAPIAQIVRDRAIMDQDVVFEVVKSGVADLTFAEAFPL